ncbi:hypothetical protein KUTeg_001008 [Tegillarca granosa]|uniref:Fibrinogen C-terminal domain-containing protein n=1 Tax=Tegillarca granosa TaxID=220873 RepID=A0ABQ9FW39_TEGGR|nr:hypothetical protein KUTeg_001008 [Tegillarca granosa]
MKTDGGGWIVIQKRFNGATNFYRTWQEYKQGFGNKTKEYWLGNDRIHFLTKLKFNKLRVDLEDFKFIQKYATYSYFAVHNESTGYILNVGGYVGTAGDSLSYHNGYKFSRQDKDNDISTSNCAVKSKGAWWYRRCYSSNLNGMYMENVINHQSLVWYTFHNNSGSLKRSEMKIKRIQ